ESRDQSPGQRDGDATPAFDLRGDDPRHRALPPHHRPNVHPCAHKPGHVPGRDVSHVPRADADGRQSPGRRRAGLDRSEDSVSMTVFERPATAVPDALAAPAPAGAAAGRIGLSRRQLVWRRFLRSRAAVAGGLVVLAFYLVALCANFLAPYGVEQRFIEY